MGGKSKSQKTDVTEYRLSVHFSIGVTVDALLGLYVNEKTAWEGEYTAEASWTLYQPELFGGDKKEGGLVGIVHYLPGGPTQTLNEYLAPRLGRTTDNCPAFRGISTFFMVGTDGGGFKWSMNNPIVAQNVWAKVRRIPPVLDSGTARIGDDANPAHIIFDCLTNTDWGMGSPSSAIDVASFTACATALFDESFGMSLVWAQQSTIEDFISEVIDHIQATLFVNPRTGLLTLKLIRDDYDFATLRQMNPDNSDLLNFQRKMWGETVNEIVVTWTNPVNEKEETLTIQDLANIGTQGAPISDGRNYYGVRNKELAARLAARDIRIASAPLAMVDVELDRSAWDVLPGEVVRLSWPEYDLEDIVMRVGNVAYGRPGEPAIKVTLLEDVFSLERAVAPDPPTTGWPGTGADPEPMEETQVITVPAFFLTSQDFQPDDITLNYPEVAAGILAYQSGTDTASYELLSESVSTTGVLSFTNAGTKTAVGRIASTGVLAAEAQSLMPASWVASQLRGPQIGGFIFIGTLDADDGGTVSSDALLLSGDESGTLLLSGDAVGRLLISESLPIETSEAISEIALIDSFDGTNFVLTRGVLDTVPRDWPIGTPLWFVNGGIRIVDDRTLRSVGESVDYKLLSRTSRGLLDEADAPIATGLMSARPHLPYRPANVKVNGVAFGSVAVPSGNIVITWATRSRVLEDVQVMKWTDGSVPPEYLQETVVVVYDPSGNNVYEHTGLWTESSLTLPSTAFARFSYVDVTVRARRNGLWSLQGHTIRVTGLANDSGAAAPPTPPSPGPPPPVGSAPISGQWVAAPIDLSSNGSSLPAIQVDGSTSDNPDAEGVIVEILESGETEWITVMTGPATTKRVTTSALQGLTSYYVGISYVLNGLVGNRLVIGPYATTSIVAAGQGVRSNFHYSNVSNRPTSETVIGTGSAVNIPNASGNLKITASVVLDTPITDRSFCSLKIRAATLSGDILVASAIVSIDTAGILNSAGLTNLSALLIDFPYSGSVTFKISVAKAGPSTLEDVAIDGDILIEWSPA